MEAEALRNRRKREERNLERLDLADRTDELTTGECGVNGLKRRREERSAYLQVDAAAFFREPVRGPDDTNDETPDWFIVELTKAAREETRVPAKAPIRFEPNSEEAAETNARILRECNFSMTEMIQKFVDMTLGYGSEFRTVNQLRPLIGGHPNFEKLAQVISTGMPYVFKTELDPVTKLAELRTLLRRGNHKSAD